MSQEVYRILRTMNRRDLKTQLALQCSPLLTDLKISNLLIVHNDNIEDVIEIFKNTKICASIICERDKKTTFLLYKKDELLEYLNDQHSKEIMKSLGYRSLDLEEILKEFSKRYQKYMIDKEEFPHEMGLLLGYPTEDVVGFIENKGKNSLYTGYWKVYSNLTETISLFDEYNKAKEIVVKMVSQGISIQNILDMYHSNKFNRIAV